MGKFWKIDNKVEESLVDSFPIEYYAKPKNDFGRAGLICIANSPNPYANMGQQIWVNFLKIEKMGIWNMGRFLKIQKYG